MEYVSLVVYKYGGKKYRRKTPFIGYNPNNLKVRKQLEKVFHSSVPAYNERSIGSALKRGREYGLRGKKLNEWAQLFAEGWVPENEGTKESLFETFLTVGGLFTLESPKKKTSGQVSKGTFSETNETEHPVSKTVESGLGWLGKLLSEGLIRLLEIIGGAVLVLFGLWVLVKGETPKAVPIPV